MENLNRERDIVFKLWKLDISVRRKIFKDLGCLWNILAVREPELIRQSLFLIRDNDKIPEFKAAVEQAYLEKFPEDQVPKAELLEQEIEDSDPIVLKGIPENSTEEPNKNIEEFKNSLKVKHDLEKKVFLLTRALRNMIRTNNFLNLYLQHVAGDITETEVEDTLNAVPNLYTTEIERSASMDEFRLIAEIQEEIKDLYGEFSVNDVSDLYSLDITDCFNEVMDVYRQAQGG